MAVLVLISGSNNSGKSVYAEQLIARTSGSRYYIATMRPCTEDNHRRIEKHRAQRKGLGFETLECPCQIGDAPISADGVVLLEDVSNLLACWGPLCFAGMLSMGLAYSLQIVGQKNVNPSVAALMLGMESLFAALAGWVFLHEVMTGKEKLGCAIMFAAILLVELMPEKRKKE